MLSLPLVSINLCSLPINVVKEICKLGMHDKQCRYLSMNNEQPDVFHCLKTRPHLAKVVDGEVESVKKRLREIGKLNISLPFGNNCPGFQILEPT